MDNVVVELTVDTGSGMGEVKTAFEVDPREVTVDGIVLEELLFSHKRETRRTGVIG